MADSGFAELLDQFCDAAPQSLRVYADQMRHSFDSRNFSQLEKVLQLLQISTPAVMRGQAAQLQHAFEQYIHNDGPSPIVSLTSNHIGERTFMKTIAQQLREMQERQMQDACTIKRFDELYNETWPAPEPQLNLPAQTVARSDIDTFYATDQEINRLIARVQNSEREQELRELQGLITRIQTDIGLIQDIICSNTD